MFKQISKKDIIDFNKTFSLMLISRLSIIQALELLYSQLKNDSFKTILKNIIADVKSGNTLSGSFSKYPDLFPEIYTANLKIGEETGTLADVLTEYSEYVERNFTLKRKILQAARYPVLVIIVSICVVSFMSFFLIPSFEGLFTSSKAQLPALTAVIINTSYFLKRNAYIIALFFIFLIVLFRNYKKSKYLTDKIEKLIISVPVISGLYKKNILARFSLSMAILLKSKITLVEALKISKNAVNNNIFRSEIDKVINRIIKGERFSDKIASSVFFDTTFSRLLVYGEESAELEKVFMITCNYYSKEFDYQLDNVTNLIEPILILFVGIIVAVVLIAMYLPMFELMNNFGL